MSMEFLSLTVQSQVLPERFVCMPEELCFLSYNTYELVMFPLVQLIDTKVAGKGWGRMAVVVGIAQMT
jgi:hypothetical protein